jgi:hypothetical protein
LKAGNSLLISKLVLSYYCCFPFPFQLLETLIKNCGDFVHMQVAEKDILHEMVIAKKKMQVPFNILLCHSYLPLRHGHAYLNPWQTNFWAFVSE